nr:PREDICTED: N-acetyllactosaminide alpha-1,3-galactosyltransferase-like [Pundamilia nyererei]
MRIRTISETIGSEIRHKFRYVFCFDVDQEFKGRFGSEALGDSVALLHTQDCSDLIQFKSMKNYFPMDKPWFTPKLKKLWLEKRKAFRSGDRDCYREAKYRFTKEVDVAKHQHSEKMQQQISKNDSASDKINNVEALWHDESHLNKYFWIHKPSRLLSPEYCWDQSIWDKRDILVTRLVWEPKHYDTLCSG